MVRVENSQQSFHLHWFGSFLCCITFFPHWRYFQSPVYLLCISRTKQHWYLPCIEAFSASEEWQFHRTPSVMFPFYNSLYIGIVSSGLAEMQFSKLSGQNCVAFNSPSLTKFLKPPADGVSYAWCFRGSWNCLITQNLDPYWSLAWDESSLGVGSVAVVSVWSGCQFRLRL